MTAMANPHVLRVADLEPEVRPPFDLSGRHTIALGIRPETVGSRNMSVNVIRIAPQFGTPLHDHVYEEGWYVLAGAGILRVEEEKYAVTAGDLLFVASDVPHQIVNDSEQLLELLAITAPPVQFELCRIIAPFDESDLK
jgi:mannose-6-phosphate isomerase-like protein (cupin superfamily)